MTIRNDLESFYRDFKSQDFAFYMVAAYCVFSYLRPQVIYPWLNFIPWTQLSILAGLGYLVVNNRLSPNAPTIWSFLFALMALISSMNSAYPETSFSKVDIPFIWCVEVLFFTNAIKSLKQFKLIMILLLLILFKMSFFGARVWATRGFGFTSWGISGPPGYFQNSGEFSLLMAMLAVMSFAFLWANKNVNRWYYLLPLTAVMAVMGASSRGGQLALLVGLLWVNIFIVRIRFKSLLVALLLFVITFSLLPQEQKDRFTSMGEDGTSISRIIYWKAGIEMALDHPFVGVGYESFPLYFNENYNFMRSDGEGYSLSRKEVSHNSLVQVGSTLGLIALFIYLFLHRICFSLNSKVRAVCEGNKQCMQIQFARDFSKGLDSAVVTYFMGSLFMSIAFYPYIYLLMMLSFVLKNTVSTEIGVKNSA